MIPVLQEVDVYDELLTTLGLISGRPRRPEGTTGQADEPPPLPQHTWLLLGLVHYRLRATTRFREYFALEELAPLPPSDDPSLPVDDGRSTVSAEIDLHVPNTSLPAPPMVHSVIPLFRWEDGTEPDQPMATVIAPTAYSRIKSQPIIQATSSPSVA